MSYLYLLDNTSKVGIEDNYVTVLQKNGEMTKIPSQTLESISIFGNAVLTVPCIHYCLLKGIPVSFYSKGGKYFGKLMSTGHINVTRQRQQDALHKKNFAIDFAKKIINAKIHNQIVVAKRYSLKNNQDQIKIIKSMKTLQGKLSECKNISEIMGYEGNCAKLYFSILGQSVNEEFAFKKRSRRPPLDAFNSMLSLGYSIVLNEIYGKIENRGLNPYFGFLHQDRENHPTLASDLMEEWRAVLIDSMVMSLVNGHEISINEFYQGEKTDGIFLTHEGMKIFIKKLEKKMETVSNYLDYVSYGVSFRRAMELQVDSLVHAVEKEDIDEYRPVMIR